MKIGRRSFLSFLIGGAAGTTLSPLPWKLTDDLSIWTQNWPWTPIPEDGEASRVQTTCTLCPGGCGISVRKVGDRAVKIEGMQDHPVNKGGICILGLAGLQLLYGPTRVKAPLKRVGDRGEGKWVEISWNQAISEVAEKLGEIRSSGKPHTLACIAGSDRGTISQLLGRFLTVYGSPNFLRTPSMYDSYELALYLMQGAQASAGFDFESVDFVLSFGSGIIDGWGSPVRMFKANSLWQEKGCRVVQIEPRLSNTAAKSDAWIPINPGTEAALALGLAHVIVKERLYNDFVNTSSFGFYDWYDDQGSVHRGFEQVVLHDYAPDTVSQITGIDANTIVELAQGFAKAVKPLAICGRGQGLTPGSTHEFMAVHALNALVGNINKPGGVLAVPDPDYIRWPEPAMDQTASQGMQKGRLDDAGGERYPYTRYLMNRFFENIASSKGYPISALLINASNPLYCLPDNETVKKAFNRIDFIASFSSYMDETTLYADLILPNHCYLERQEDIPSPAGFEKPFIGLSKAVVEPHFNTKHIGDTIIEIAKAMGGNIAEALSWDGFDACLQETLGEKWDMLNDKGYWIDEQFLSQPEGALFETASGKFEFFVKAISTGHEKELDALPRYKPLSIEGDGPSFPLLLIPYDTMRLASGYVYNPPFVIKTVEDTVLKGNDIFVEVNPKTAAALGLAEGNFATLSTPKGIARVRVHLFDGLMPGLVAMPRGLGHTAYDSYLAGKGINFNELIGPVPDPVSGLDAAFGIRAKLSAA